jgi:signal transduction histidine kinase
MSKIKGNLKKIKMYAAGCPENQAAKQYLVEAELARINGKNPIQLYKNAIEMAHKNAILQEEALANELLGRFYNQQKDSENAKKTLLNARKVYFKWGANAKVSLLDNEFSAFFQMEEKKATNLTETRFTQVNTLDITRQSSNSSNIEFDMGSMIKSSITISSEIVMEKLSSKLMQVVIENAGAQNGYLLLKSHNNWHIMAGGNVDKNTATAFDMPLANNHLLPESVVNYVIRTKENLVVYDIQEENLFSRDPIVAKLALNSVLCLPILNQGQLIGIIYLENSLNSGVFNEQRVEFLKLLSGQIAVSLQNALTYENLEQKVKERTLEIEKEKQKVESTLLQLKATQDQLIQSEKLASLGELTAGIAHEIQNPLNFVTNFSELSIDIAKELNEELNRPDFDKGYIEELLSDLTSNQEKVNQHGKRASSIVKGMLEHSRSSNGIKELCNINKLADEYLRLSYHGLRAKDKNFNATFVTDFDEKLPHITVITQDLGRVLLNLINNAFYAVNQRKTNLDDTISYTPTVTVFTQNTDNHIVIKIIDNGTGMPNSVKEKVFKPFFTTKPTGEGTGLGLSLSYDIVTKGHGGTLEVNSTEGEGTEFVISLPL